MRAEGRGRVYVGQAGGVADLHMDQVTNLTCGVCTIMPRTPSLPPLVGGEEDWCLSVLVGGEEDWCGGVGRVEREEAWWPAMLIGKAD